mgnify:CR=1 FL=1
MLAFQPYHSLIEMRRYAVRFMHQLHLIRVLTQAIFQNAVDFNEFALVMRCDDDSHVPIPFVASLMSACLTCV